MKLYWVAAFLFSFVALAQEEICRLPLPDRQGDASIQDIKELIEKKGYASFTQLLADPKMKNHRNFYTMGYQGANGPMILLVGKSGRLVIRTRGMAPLYEGETENIEYLEFQEKERSNYQGNIEFSGDNKPVFVSSDMPSELHGTALDEFHTCNHCHAGGREGVKLRKYALAAASPKSMDGFFGSQGELIPEGSEEFREYKRLLDILFPTQAGAQLTSSAWQLRKRLELFHFRAKELPPPLMKNGKKHFATIHGPQAPNQYFLDKIEELNAHRVLEVIVKDKNFSKNKYLLFAWANDACSETAQWATFNIDGFDPEKLELEKSFWLKSATEENREASAQVFMLTHLLKLQGLAPLAFSGGLTINLSLEGGHFYHSDGGIHHFKKIIRQYQRTCAKDVTEINCDEYAEAFRKNKSARHRSVYQ